MTVDDIIGDPNHRLRVPWAAETRRRRIDNDLIMAQRERVEGAAWDMLAFGRTYLPHYFGDTSAKFHPELVKLLTEMDPMEWYVTEANPDYDPLVPTVPICDQYDHPIDYTNHPRRREIDPSTGQPSKKQGIAVAAPRGHGKSTLLTLLIPIYCACYRLRKFIVIVSDADVQVRSFCSDIKREFEENDLIRRDFGDLVGTSWGRKWTGEDFIISHAEPNERGQMRVVFEMRIAGRSTGSKMRGLRNRENRPDLVICDDIENDTHVQSDTMREALYKKVIAVFVPALDPHTGIFLFCGTILHHDSVLSRLLHQESAKDYVQRRWAAADRDIMDDGAVPIWPERFPLSWLRSKRSQMPAALFNKEYMNDPNDPESKDFRPEWIRWYHVGDMRRDKAHRLYWKNPDDPETNDTPGRPLGVEAESNWQEVNIYQAVDPAISQSQRADYFTMAAVGCTQRSEDIIVLWYVRERLDFAAQVNEIHSMAHTYPRTRCIAIESVAYQDALRQAATARMNRRFGRTRIPLKPLRQKTGPNTKEARLRRRAVEVEHGMVWLRRLDPGDKGYDSAPWDETNTIKIHPNHYQLYLELMQFPNSAHDDCLDVLDMTIACMGRTRMFADWAEQEREAVRGGKVPTTRTRGPRANVPGEDPNWKPEWQEAA